jgi:hypothetical protein
VNEYLGCPYQVLYLNQGRNLMSFFSISKTLTVAAMVSTSWMLTQSGQAAHAFAFAQGNNFGQSFTAQSFGSGVNLAQLPTGSEDDSGDSKGVAIVGGAIVLIVAFAFLLDGGSGDSNADVPPSLKPEPHTKPVPTPLLLPGLMALCLRIRSRQKGAALLQSA